MTESTEPNYDAMDPGIRETVRWLRGLGFETCDSGDGVSKGEDGLLFPHVFIEPRSYSNGIATANMLLWHLKAAGFEVGPVGRGHVFIESSYDPVDGSSIVSLHGVDDAMLRELGVIP